MNEGPVGNTSIQISVKMAVVFDHGGTKYNP